MFDVCPCQRLIVSMSSGFFISFEGSEGCGKSSQIQLLVKRLMREGLEAVRVREPGGTPLGERIRDLLQHAPEGQSMCPETELLLFNASRAQLVRQVIAPALANGQWVVADRFYDSTSVYQGLGRGLDRAAVAEVIRIAVGQTRPDLTLVLDVTPEVAQQRIRQRAASKDRFERESEEFFQRVRQGFLDLAADDPGRIRVVDSNGTIEQVHEQIWDLVTKTRNGIST